MNDNSYGFLFLKTAIFGACRSAISLPLEHPFDTIKTNMQDKRQTIRKTITDIYRGKGIKGFYSGFSVNLCRAITKQSYRWPLSIGIDGYYRRVAPETDKVLLASMTGLTMSIIQVGIICPFERIKVWLMTSNKYSNIRAFFKQLPLISLYDGLIPVFWKQCISWVSFLGSQQLLKQIVCNYSGKNREKQSLNKKQLLFVTIGVALLNTFVVQPFDYIKTNFQSFKKNEFISFRSFVLKHYQNYGILNFYVGWQIKLIQYMINATFTVTLYDRLMQEYRVLRNKKIQN